jgi:RNA polymerase sigma-70 factor (ECF subfamily)
MEETLRRARRGSERAFLEILEKYEHDLYRTAWLYVKNEQDALDVMQETAFRAFISIRTLKEPKYLKTWLTRIVINCALDRLRKDGRLRCTELDVAENDLRLSTAFEGALVDRLTLEALLSVLSDAERSVVVLKYVHQYTFAEISKTMQLPLGTVKTILYRALNRLRTEAKKEDPQ